MAKYETTKSNKLKQSAKDMEKLQTNQKNEKGTFERNKVEQQKNLVKQQNTILTKEQKIQGNERAKAQKDFKDGLKQQKVDLQKKTKRNKSIKRRYKKNKTKNIQTLQNCMICCSIKNKHNKNFILITTKKINKQKKLFWQTKN